MWMQSHGRIFSEASRPSMPSRTARSCSLFTIHNHINLTRFPLCAVSGRISNSRRYANQTEDGPKKRRVVKSTKKSIGSTRPDPAPGLRKEYMDLCQEIRKHDKLYYADTPSPIISDKEYDMLMSRLLKMEQEHPEWITEDSPTQAPGHSQLESEAVLQPFVRVQHALPMLSLMNTYDESDVRDYIARIRKDLVKLGCIDPEDNWNSADGILFKNKLPLKDPLFCVELKIDGLGVSLTYERGKLARAATRGDGQIGDDVTRNAFHVRGIPRELRSQSSGKSLSWNRCEVRGEIYISKSDFQYISSQRELSGDMVYSNPRNAAAGSLKLLDPAEVPSRRLAFIAYEMVVFDSSGSNAIWTNDTYKSVSKSSISIPATQKETILRLDDLGFEVVPLAEEMTSAEDILALATKVESQRANLEVEVDGLVLKVNRHDFRLALGTTSKAPRGAVAYKFKAQRAETILRSISPQVSRYGVITPVALFDTISIGGVKVSRATLHNYAEVARLGVRIGDHIVVERSGDVIPKIIDVVAKGNKSDDFLNSDKNLGSTSSNNSIHPPSHCPACDEPTVQDGKTNSSTGIFIRCVNPTCPAQNLEKIRHFASKSAMDIDSLGAMTCKKLLEAGLITRAADLYNLDVSMLQQQVAGFKGKSATRLIQGIQDSRNSKPLHCILIALGIPGVGASTAKLIAGRLKQITEKGATEEEFQKALLQNLFTLTEENLASIFGVGDVMKSTIISHLTTEDVQADLRALIDSGVRPAEIWDATTSPMIPVKDSPLKGKVVVFTGNLGDDLTRSKAAAIAEQHGAIVKSNITVKTDYLIAGDDAGSKIDTAIKLNVPIVSRFQFDSMINDKLSSGIAEDDTTDEATSMLPEQVSKDEVKKSSRRSSRKAKVENESSEANEVEMVSDKVKPKKTSKRTSRRAQAQTELSEAEGSSPIKETTKPATRATRKAIAPSMIPIKDSPLKGKVVVFTGNLGDDLTRSKAAAIAEQYGAIVKSNITVKTDYLIAGDDAGSKIDTAIKLNIPVLSRVDFDAMINSE